MLRPAPSSAPSLSLALPYRPVLTLLCNSYDAVLPVHHLWLGYISELLAVPLLIPLPTAPSLAPAATSTSSAELSITSTLLPTFPSRHAPPTLPRDEQINVVNLHAKMVKADFTGCSLSGASSSSFRPSCPPFARPDTDAVTHAVKRAKNPSLVGLRGLVLQETHGTFKLVTPDSKVKGALDSISPSLGRGCAMRAFERR